ncbi:hypothetical protein EVAR_21329_1 [Eumeta japonica]|uniref:Uncharacterized protein n=1 Tax=Eumeta variegata TaxID=151549 RepID=A0A4C1ZMV5_EUMVA|nr:hypothetical protein EVAR_21329_1 [Eumeta japonica]
MALNERVGTGPRSAQHPHVRGSRGPLTRRGSLTGTATSANGWDCERERERASESHGGGITLFCCDKSSTDQLLPQAELRRPHAPSLKKPHRWYRDVSQNGKTVPFAGDYADRFDSGEQRSLLTRAVRRTAGAHRDARATARRSRNLDFACAPAFMAAVAHDCDPSDSIRLIPSGASSAGESFQGAHPVIRERDRD